MKLLAALAAGYVLGSLGGRNDVDDVIRSLRAIRDSEEFHDFVSSVRTHAVHTLRELASRVEGGADDRAGSDAGPAAVDDGPSASPSDLVEQVRRLAGLG